MPNRLTIRTLIGSDGSSRQSGVIAELVCRCSTLLRQRLTTPKDAQKNSDVARWTKTATNLSVDACDAK